MIFRNVERLEVVPFVFDLGSLCDREAESPHDVLEFVHRLDERVLFAKAQGRAGQREIEPAGDRLGSRQLLLTRFKRGFDLGLGLVEALADDRPLGRVDFPDECLHVAHSTMLSAGKFHTHGFKRRGISGRGDRGQRRLFVGDNFADRVHGIDVRSRPRANQAAEP